MNGRAPVVLSVEQALSMSYATLRFAHLGWRVIRIEATPVPGRPTCGDPNRSIGRPIAGLDRHSYFVAPNAGKEAIALDLKSQAGREALKRILVELDVDVFCTNTMPSRHERLGMDYATLSALKPDLIWCCISAMGLRHPNVPGYDPVVQALCGYMDLTGDPEGPPMQCGPPIIDLKAGDEAFAQVMLALWERSQAGSGKCIDVSMAHSAASLLQTFLPMLDMDSPPDELRRSGNQHRQFIPVNAYATADGYIYLAIGSDAQWGRLVGGELFGALQQPRFATNESRRSHKADLHAAIEAITRRQPSEVVAVALAGAAIPHAPITPVEGVMKLPFVAESALHTVAPDGRVVRLPPPAVPTAHLEATSGEVPFCPGYGEHTRAVLAEAGHTDGEITSLVDSGAVAVSLPTEIAG